VPMPFCGTAGRRSPATTPRAPGRRSPIWRSCGPICDGNTPCASWPGAKPA
jgi:hypothetical protein